MIANGNQTIEGQHVPSASTIAELSELLRQNEELRQRLESVSRRAAEDAELQLRRLGADLHDGPAQLVALALLKLDLLPEDGAENPGERQMIRSVLEDAMSEIRDISAGLALPAIGKLSLAQALIVVATEHERRTSTRVSVEFPTRSIDLPHTIKLCLCRFVQEGLSNAFKHAGGVGQTVSASWTDTMMEVAVGDAGPGVKSGTQGREAPGSRADRAAPQAREPWRPLDDHRPGRWGNAFDSLLASRRRGEVTCKARSAWS